MKKKLSGRINKQEFVAYLDNNPDKFNETIKISLENDIRLSWRATWVLFHSIENNDKRIQPYIKDYIEAVKNKKDGHQRELLKLLDKMEIPEDIEGYLFDVCVSIWEQVNKISSVRITALRIIFGIAKKYPELNNEIEFFTHKRFIDTLSPGIKWSFYKMKKNLHN